MMVRRKDKTPIPPQEQKIKRGSTTYFRYIGYNIKNKKVSGVVRARSEEEARIKIANKKITIISIKESRVTHIKKLRKTEMKFFAFNMAAFIRTGFPITDALSLLTKKSVNKNFEQVVQEVLDNITMGISFSDAVKNTGAFSDLFISFCRAGEGTGRLDQALQNIADFYDVDIKVSNKLHNVMMYPVILIVMMFVILFAYVFYVMPQISTVFIQTGFQLPWITRAVMGFGTFITNYWWIVLILIGIGIYVKRHVLAKPIPITYRYENFLFHSPIFGQLYEQPEYLRLGTVLLNGYDAGVSITDIMKMAEDVATSQTFKRIIHEAQKKVVQGSSLSEAFEDSNLQEVFVKTIALGEKSGNLSESLKNYLALIQSDYTQAVENFSARIEPISIIIIGIVVGVVVIAMYMPIFDMVPAMLRGG